MYFKAVFLHFRSRSRERVHNVDFWMSSFLRNIGTVIAEDGEEVLPTTMQPVTIDDFQSYLAPYVGNKVVGLATKISLEMLAYRMISLPCKN